MNRLLEKVAAFRNAASSAPVRVNIHEGKKPLDVDRLVMYACVVAGVVGLTVANIPTPHEEQARIKERQQRQEIIEQVIKPERQMIKDERESQSSYEQPGLKPRLNYVTVQFQGKEVQTLDEASRVMLVKDAAAAHELGTVGLTWKDLYGIIHAETAWVARDGMGKNGVKSLGLAQLEPNTAKALNITDPHDPVQAIHATAALMKEGAIWTRSRLAGARLSAKEFGAKLREGVSIYYNLSTAGRKQWDGRNTEEMPVETQHHIRNSQDGAKIAAAMDKRLMATYGPERLTAAQRSITSYRQALFDPERRAAEGLQNTSYEVADSSDSDRNQRYERMR